MPLQCNYCHKFIIAGDPFIVGSEILCRRCIDLLQPKDPLHKPVRVRKYAPTATTCEERTYHYHWSV